MEKVIETERLFLRRMDDSDYGDLCLILMDDETMYAYEGAFTAEEARIWLDKQIESYEAHGIGLWAVIDKESGAFVGQCGLTYQTWKDRKVLEVGYLFNKAYWHNGFAAEAASACREYAFTALGASEVSSIIRSTNCASMRVAVRNRMLPRDTWTKRYRGADMPHILFTAERD